MSENEPFARFLPFRYFNQHPIINLIQIRCSQPFISKLTPNSLEFTLFNDLVFLESNQIQILAKRLIKNSIFDSFQPFLKLFNFNCNKYMDSLTKFITNHQMIKNKRGTSDEINDHLIIIFFFYLLEFIIFHKQFLFLESGDGSEKIPNLQNSQRQVEVFVKLIRELNLIGKPKDELIESIHSCLFIQLILHFLNYETIKDINQMVLPPQMNCHTEWTQEMYDQCAIQFFIGPVFRMSSSNTSKNNSFHNQFAYSLILTVFAQKSIKSNNNLNPSKILEIIYSLLFEQRVSFSNIQICSILLPLIQELNTKAIKIISILSSISTDLSTNTKDDFIQLPPLIFQKIMGNAINDYDTKSSNENLSGSFINQPSISKELFQTPNDINNQISTQKVQSKSTTEKDQQLKLTKTKSDFFEKKRFYKEKDPTAFENGFISAQAEINFYLFDLFSQNNLNHFLIEFFYSMENACNECLDEYIYAYFKLLSIYNDSDFYYDLYLIGFLFIDKFKDRVNLADLFNFLFDSQVFNPNLTIFNNNEKKDLSIVTTLRFKILNTYITEMDSILPSFFIKSEMNPFIFTEMIVYIMQSYMKNNTNSFLQSFLSKKFVQSFFKVLNFFIRERYELNNTSEGIFSAFQTNLSFLFTLLNDQIKGESLFQIHSFCRNFLSLVFIDSLQKVVLTTIRNLLLKVNPSSMALSPLTISICQLLQTLQSSKNDRNLNTSKDDRNLNDDQNSNNSKDDRNLNDDQNSNNSKDDRNLNDDQNSSTFKDDRNLSEDQGLSISINIVQNLISLLSSNGSISPFFSNIFDFVINLKHFPNLLEYSLTFTSLISRNIPNFKLKSYQLKRLASIIVNEHKTKAEKVPSDTKEEDQSEVLNISDQTYLLLLNLCAATTTLGNSTMFLIKQPTFIPLVFIVFQHSSSKLRYIMQNFIDLCNYSISNCFACHFSGIDLLLLDFIYNFKFENSNKVNFREIEFNFNFKLEDITKYILPFLSMILTYSTDSIVISRIIEIINDNKFNEISLIMSSFLLNSITNSKSQLSILHPLGFNVPFLTVNNVDPEILNKRFVLTFWIKIDRLISLSEKHSIEILRISNKKAVYHKPLKIQMANNYGQMKENSLNLKMSQTTSNLPQKKLKNDLATTFRLFVKRGVFYFSYYTPGSLPVTEQIYQNIDSNQWIFCAFVTQRSSPEMSSVCLYSGNHVGYCQDVSKIYFPSSHPLTISFGGKGKGINNRSLTKDPSNDRQFFRNYKIFKNKISKENDKLNSLIDNSINQNEGNLVGVLGPFALFDTLLSEEELSSISKAGPSLISDDFNGWLIKSSKSPIEFSIQKTVLTDVTIEQNDFSLAPHSIISEVCLYNHLIQLSKPFLNINKAPENFLGTIIGIMKQIFLTSSVLQKDFYYFDIIAKLMISSSFESSQANRINYHLYLNFLSLFECITFSRTSELFFDSLLINVELWYLCCNPSNFGRIIFHWSHTLVNMYPSFFKRPNFLLKLYKTYFVLFDKELSNELKIENSHLKKPIVDYSKDELNDCNDRFLFLLEEATKLAISFENEFLLYFYLILDLFEKHISFNENNNIVDSIYFQRLKFFLNVLIKNAAKFKKYEEFNHFLFKLISNDKYSNEPEIIKLAIFAIHEMQAPVWFEPMSSLGYTILCQKRKTKNSNKQNLNQGNETQNLNQGNETQNMNQGNETQNMNQGNKIQNMNQGNETQNMNQGNETQNMNQGNETQNMNQGNETQNMNQGNETKNLNQGNETQNMNQGNETKNLNQGNETKNLNQGNETKNLNQGNETKNVENNSKNLNSWTTLVRSLLRDIEYYPGIMHLIAVFILGTSEDEDTISDLEFSDSMNILVNSTVFSMRDKEKTPIVIKSIISDKYWFLWLLFIAIQSENEDHRQPIMLLISNFASFSDDPEKQLNHLIEVILILNSFIKNIDEYSILLDLLVNILAHGTVSMTSASTSLVLSLLFKFCYVFHNNILIKHIESSPLFVKDKENEEEEIMNSSFFDENELTKENEMNSFDNIENSEEIENSIHPIISEFRQFAKNEKKISKYKLRFGLTVESSSLEKLYDLLIQTIQTIDYKLNFPGYKKILDYVSIVLKHRFAKHRSIEDPNKGPNSELNNIKLNETINYFNDNFLNDIFKSIKEMKELIERIEKVRKVEMSDHLIEDDVKKKFIEIPILSSSSQKTTVDNYFTFMVNFATLDFDSKKEISRDFYSFLFPMKTKFKEVFNDLKIENIDFFNDYEIKYLVKSSNLIKTKATFYNFDDAPIEVYFILHLHDFVINIIDIKSKIKLFTIPGSTILFIQSNLNAIEFYTENQGSFYFTFHESFLKEKESIISKLKNSFPNLNKTVKESLNQYLSNSMTNYEYLMYLNIISGYTFHDPDLNNRPTFPRLKNEKTESVNFMIDEVPVFNFLRLDNDQNLQNPFLCLEDLEKIDDSLIDYYAKTKYKENYFPKFKVKSTPSSEVTSQNSEVYNHSETHRIMKDLTVNPSKIRKTGFFHLLKDGLEYRLFYIIIKKEGLIHFIQISNDLFLQFFSSQKSSLLLISDEDITCSESDIDPDDEDVVIIEDFGCIEKVPGVLIFSKRRKKFQRVTPFDCSPLIDINFELCSALFSSLYSFSYAHQSSSALINSIRSSSASFYTSKSSMISNSTVSSQSNGNRNAFNFYQAEFRSLDTDLNLFSLIDKEMIFVYNKCNIKLTSNLNDLLSEKDTSKIILTNDFFIEGSNSILNSKITCIASSEKFKALAVGTENSKVIVYSLVSREVTSIIDLNNKEAEKILITPQYGFIVIEAQKTIYVYTINGQKVGEKEINFDILEWHFSYPSVLSSFEFSLNETEDSDKKKENSRNDYVVFMNSVNDIGVFEASHPEVIQFVSTSSGLIAAFDYLSFCNCVIIISINYGSIIGFYPVQDFNAK